MTSISVSIVSYFSEEVALGVTIGSLAIAGEQAGIPIHLTLIDNSDHATDTPRLARLIGEWTRHGQIGTLASFNFRQTDRNIGYGQANNIAHIGNKKDFVLILNPDVDLEPDALGEAIEHFAQNPDCVLVTPRALDENGQDLFLNHGYPSVLALLGRAISPFSRLPAIRQAMDAYELRELDINKPHSKTRSASGCFMLFRGSAFKQVSGFSPKYFMYFEDYDLSMRTSKLGRICYVPAVRLQHLGGGAAGKGFLHRRMFSVSAWRFFQCHGWQLG